MGGPAHHVTHLTERLADRYPTLLITGQVGPDEADMLPRVQERGLPVAVIPELGRTVRPGQDAVALAKLISLFRRYRPTIVHTHTAKAGTLGRVAAVSAGVPIRVHTFHGHVLHGYFKPAVTRAVIAAERTLARLSTRIVTVSDGQADELAYRFRICAREKIEVIPLGLELEQFAPERILENRGRLRAELGIDRDAPVVAIVGRLAPIKRHDVFLRAAVHVSQRLPAARFLVVGGGEEEERLRRSTKVLGLEGHVHFLGWRTDLPAIYADADVVVLTSDNEGTPVSLIEALAAGRPVVSTDVGGVREVLAGGRLGTLVPGGDAAAAAAAIVRIVEGDGRTPGVLLSAARAIRERYGVPRLVRDVETLYDVLMVEKAGRGARLQRASSVRSS